MRLFCSTLLVLSLIAASLPAAATVIFTMGNNPQPGEENVLFNNNQLGSSVTGVTNLTGITVNFSSTTNTLSVSSSGQAKVSAQNTSGQSVLVTDITVSIPGGTFTDLIANPFQSAGTVLVTAVDNLGNVFTTTLPGAPGNNFITITTSGGELLTSVTFSSTAGFTDLRQPRISGAAVPEPSSLLLLGSGLLGFAGLLRRKLRQ